MDDFLKDETFLARWASDELTAKELDAFQKHPQYDQFVRILEESINITPLDIDYDHLLKEIKLKREKQGQKDKVVPLRRKLIFSIAAAVLILISGYFFINTGETKFSTGVGEQLAINLPDGSNLILNSNSQIRYNKKSFSNNRELKLEGEGFFDVVKGGEFKVSTNNGNVQVLGTSFNVVDRDKILLVGCKTGKVKVENLTGGNVILNPGDRIRIENGILGDVDNINTISISQWKDGESKFERVPLIDVITALENQFGVDIELETNKGEDTFTGSFIHNNIDLALEMVFEPMNLKYEMKSDGTVVVR